jgi:hypothetical protein
MNPRDFLSMASGLAAKQDATPAKLHTAASRAYDTAFNVTVALLGKMGVKATDGWKGHKRVAEEPRKYARPMA